MGGLRKYSAMARTSIEIWFIYRTTFVLNMIGSIFYVFAMFYLWQTIFLGRPGALAGFTWPEMKAYLLVSFVLGSLMPWFAEWNMSMDLKEGRVAIDLARPMDFQASRFASAVGPVPFEFCSALAVGAVVAFMFGGIALPADGAHAAVFLISAALATLIKFGLVYCVSMTAFWTTGTDGITVGRVAVSNLFSGALIPLVFFPDWLRAMAAVLPFQGMVSTPALVYLGMMDGPTTALMLGVQAFWAIGLILLGRLVWRSAQRAVTINGG
jgi:ABC-2 type transport system permease protein